MMKVIVYDAIGMVRRVLTGDNALELAKELVQDNDWTFVQVAQ